MPYLFSHDKTPLQGGVLTVSLSIALRSDLPRVVAGLNARIHIAPIDVLIVRIRRLISCIRIRTGRLTEGITDTPSVLVLVWILSLVHITTTTTWSGLIGGIVLGGIGSVIYLLRGSLIHHPTSAN
jgi:hypothetical protein